MTSQLKEFATDTNQVFLYNSTQTQLLVHTTQATLKNVTDPCHRRSVRHDLSRPGFDGGGDAPSGTTDLGVVGQAMLR